jgi:hypothetical protein
MVCDLASYLMLLLSNLMAFVMMPKMKTKSKLPLLADQMLARVA